MTELRRIRVLHLGAPAGLYGAERWILALVKHLPEAEVESVVAVIKDVPDQEPALCEHAARLGVRTHQFEAFGRLSFGAVGQLKRYIEANDIDILHTHFYKTDLLGWLAVRGSGRRIISTPHGWSVRAGLKLQLYETVDRLIFPFFDAVAPLSEDLHAGLSRVPGVSPHLHFIRNGVDLSEVDATTGVAPQLAQWRADGDFIVGYVGQLISRKGLETLIRAFSNLPVERKRLVIVGEGDARRTLELLARELGASDRIHFLGFREDRLAMLKGFDVFVLPSKLEGIPRCLLESMAAGVPIASSDIPGSTALIRDNETGLLFSVDDDQALCAALIKLQKDPHLRARYAAAAHTLVRAEYSAATMASRYVDLYRNVLAPDRGTSRGTANVQSGERHIATGN